MISIDDILEQFGDRIVNQLHQNLEDEGLGQSNLAQSLTYEVNNGSVEIITAPYWEYAEKGRGPGKTPYNFVDILITWMRQYGISPNKGDERSFAWAIKKKTEKEGSWRQKHPRDFHYDEVIDENMKWLETELPKDLLSGMKMP